MPFFKGSDMANKMEVVMRVPREARPGRGLDETTAQCDRTFQQVSCRLRGHERASLCHD
jgi:hypothetical protein